MKTDYLNWFEDQETNLIKEYLEINKNEFTQFCLNQYNKFIKEWNPNNDILL